MQIPLLAGRDFNVSDTENSLQAMIVNRAFSDEYFHGEDVLGKRLKPGARDVKFHLHLNWQTTAAMRNAGIRRCSA